MKPGTENKEFDINLDWVFFKADGNIISNLGQEMIVCSNPSKKWYKKLLEKLTFGIYKAPWQYKVKLIENEN